MLHLIVAMAATEKSPLKWFLGALHPGIVHFPIALLAVAALLETLQILKKRREPAGGSAPLAYLSAVTALPAALFGFMLADHSGAEGPTVELHKWLGMATTVVAAAAAACAFRASRSPGALAGMRLSLILGAVLVLGTGYVGGELTMGEGHLLKPVKLLLGIAEPVKDKVDKPVDKPVDQPISHPPDNQTLLNPRVDFVKDIAPVINDMCFKCHGGEKVKGKLKFNTKAAAMEGGESGKAIIPFKPTLSKFLTTLTLDKDDEALMPPPKEKARPSKEQIEKIRKWIEQGADWPDGYEFKK